MSAAARQFIDRDFGAQRTRTRDREWSKEAAWRDQDREEAERLKALAFTTGETFLITSANRILARRY